MIHIQSLPGKQGTQKVVLDTGWPAADQATPELEL